MPILAGAAEANTRETIRACEYYHSLGVRAVAIVSPFYYKLSPEAVYAYFKEIGDNTPIDVTLYNIPMFASPIDVPTVQRLSEECERVVAIKDSSGDLPHMIRMIQAVRPNRPDFTFLTGWDSALMPMLLIGCDGGTNATSGIVPEVTRKLYDLTMAAPDRRRPRAAVQARDIVRRHDLLGRLSRRLSGRAQAARHRRRRKPPAVLGRPALEDGNHHPHAGLPAGRRGFRRRTSRRLPRRRQRVDPEQIGRIVRGVLAELKERGLA